MAVEVYLPQKPRAGLALPLSALDHNDIPKPPASYTEHTPARSEQLRYPQPWEGLVSHHTARKWTSYQWSGEWADPGEGTLCPHRACTSKPDPPCKTADKAHSQQSFPETRLAGTSSCSAHPRHLIQPLPRCVSLYLVFTGKLHPTFPTRLHKLHMDRVCV